MEERPMKVNTLIHWALFHHCSRGAFFYYIPGKEEEELSLVTIEEKNGYDIVRAEGTRAFKQRNIWGEYYFGKDIYKKYRKR